MMNAQEANRTSIARELHDDIGQSLAVLKIQMRRLSQCDSCVVHIVVHRLLGIVFPSSRLTKQRKGEA